jgi:hypothetical protein
MMDGVAVPRTEYDVELSLETIINMMVSHGATQILVKSLSENDNSKNQPYMAQNDLSAFNIFPVSDVRPEVTPSGNRTMKAKVAFWWLLPDGELCEAPHTKLILYPQYPEVRLSGFLLGSRKAPSTLMNKRISGRILFLGITSHGRVLGYVAAPASQAANQFRSLTGLEILGVFSVLQIHGANSKTTLLRELSRIHHLGWIESKRLATDGTIFPCNAPQCVGYTLEAELGVAANGRSEPDFLGWEIKASEVSSFNRPPTAKAITLFTPEPTGGVYKDAGIDEFLNRYGYEDQNGVPDRINFGGVFRNGARHNRTGLTMSLVGFDEQASSITQLDGNICLTDDAGNIAASWSFAHLVTIWNRKHARAAYVPAMVRTTPTRGYHYGPSVRLAEGTDFLKVLSAIAAGRVYFDPAIKMENASTSRPQYKKRSQFRIRSSDIACIYASLTECALQEATTRLD